MKRNEKDKINRISFVQLCVDNPKDGAEYLKDMANKMSECKKTSQIIERLKQVLFISQSTIYRDMGLY